MNAQKQNAIARALAAGVTADEYAEARKAWLEAEIAKSDDMRAELETVTATVAEVDARRVTAPQEQKESAT